MTDERDWETIECERALYVNRGREIILCDRLPSPVTLVVKRLKQDEELLAAIERRRNIYLAKRDKFDALAEDSETPWDRYDFAVEAIEWLADDLGLVLSERPDDPAATLKEKR